MNRNDLPRASLGERLITTKGRPSGFDYLRLGLAVSIIIVHSRTTTQGGVVHSDAVIALMTEASPAIAHQTVLPVFQLLSGVLIALHRAILPMFFVLSGFLVAGSLERSKTLLNFLGLRVIRIYPALAVEVILSAFLIGASVTTLPLKSYFQDPLFLSYLLNVFGDIHFYLPGVFEHNPWPRVVNFQLWTVPYELFCYLTLAALVVFGGMRRRIAFPLAMVGLGLWDLMERWLAGKTLTPIASGHFSGPLLVVSFLAGVSLYLYRDRISWSFPVFAVSSAALIPMLWLLPGGDHLAVAAIAYVTVYLGLTNSQRLFFIRGADYSYGIYLYGFVIQQLFVYLTAPRFWWVNALACVPLAALFAAFSWHVIEKPAQKLRTPLAAAERHYLALKGQLLARLTTAAS